MKFFKAALVGVSLLALSACSSGKYSSGDENCETKASSAQVEELETKVGDRIFFAYDSSALSAEAQETLRKQAAFMEQNPELTFTVEGHADERGTREYNMALGARRANVAIQFLVGLGIDSKRLTEVSYGKERPAVLGSNDWSWSQNRRSVTVAQ
jgi:peptidoglycan-associated lipoprotein